MGNFKNCWLCGSDRGLRMRCWGPGESDGNDMYIKVASETAERGRKRGSRFDDGPFFLFFSLLPIVCSNGGLEVLNIPTREKTGRKSCSREGGRMAFYYIFLYFTILYSTLLSGSYWLDLKTSLSPLSFSILSPAVYPCPCPRVPLSFFTE